MLNTKNAKPKQHWSLCGQLVVNCNVRNVISTISTHNNGADFKQAITKPTDSLAIDTLKMLALFLRRICGQ